MAVFAGLKDFFKRGIMIGVGNGLGGGVKEFFPVLQSIGFAKQEPVDDPGK